ncbi:MAG: 2-dehydropantoate 2-reductase, partial [Lachnospiraceae bacterium]|nr:2-dehydropantoate 2-reductase [Lachnospiraceae bacterium]
MKYLIIGVGGTGGILGFKLTKGGMDVTMISRGEHLRAMQENGLTVHKIWDGQTESLPVKAIAAEDYQEQPDVILVCVKGYSLDGVYPLIRRVSGSDTVVIPILNIYGTGGRMQEELPGILVTDGCIYVSANIESPGVLQQHGKICRVVFGVRKKDEFRPVLAATARVMEESERR